MVFIIFVLLGIASVIVKVNEWFIIPDFISWICFGIAAIFGVLHIITYFSASSVVGKIKRNF